MYRNAFLFLSLLRNPLLVPARPAFRCRVRVLSGSEEAQVLQRAVEHPQSPGHAGQVQELLRRPQSEAESGQNGGDGAREDQPRPCREVLEAGGQDPGAAPVGADGHAQAHGAGEGRAGARAQKGAGDAAAAVPQREARPAGACSADAPAGPGGGMEVRDFPQFRNFSQFPAIFPQLLFA